MGVCEEYQLGSTSQLSLSPALLEGVIDIFKKLCRHTRVYGNHTFRTLTYVVESCSELHISQRWPVAVAMIHDCGKIDTDAVLLANNKPNPLEMEELRNHSIKGYRYLKEYFKYNPTADPYKVELLAQGEIRYHTYQRLPHPLTLPEPTIALTEADLHDIRIWSQIGALADNIDSMTRRNNSTGKRIPIHDTERLLAAIAENAEKLLPLAEYLLPRGVFKRFKREDYWKFYRSLHVA